MKNRIRLLLIIAIAIAGMVSSGCSNSSGDSGGRHSSEAIIYVSPAGNDSNPGTQAEPKLTIQNAIAAGTAPCEVHVSEGTYEISSQITMTQGVSIMGGYSSDFNKRDPAGYPSIIIDTRTPASGTIYAIYSSGISSAATIDGFIVNCARAVNPGNSRCIYNISSTPIITNNIIIAGSGFVADGIDNEYSSPTITNNTINGGTGKSSACIYNVSSSPTVANNTLNGGDAEISYGVCNQLSSNPSILNNTISGGPSSYASVGIWNENSSSPAITNNTINGGSGATSAKAIVIKDTSSPLITNNVIFTQGGATRYGIQEVQASSDPASVRNNAFFGCPSALYRDEDSTNITAVDQAVSTGEGSQTLSFWGNINEGSTAMFVDFANKDLHLQNTAPLNVRGGGVVVSGVTTDKDGAARTTSSPTGMTNTGAAGWSMGAYENDAP